jgi:cell division protein FtsL
MEAIAAAATAIAPYAPVIQAVGTAVSVISSVNAADAQKQQANLQAQKLAIQAEQSKLQGRQNALNYSNQANQIFERQLKIASAARARAAAAGIDPFTGSPMTSQQADAVRAGREFQMLRENADLAVYGGLAASQDLRAASAIAGGFSTAPALLAAASTGLMGVAKFGESAKPSSTPKPVVAPIPMDR